ncbi:MAG: sensor histidine kinase [Bacteroidota bacterium]
MIAFLFFFLPYLFGTSIAQPTDTGNMSASIQEKNGMELLKIHKLEIISPQNIGNYMIIVALLVILILTLAILIYNRFKLKKRNNRKLEEKNKQLKEANERLRDSEYTQRELNATKDKLFSIIAHDLKNPFQALFGISEALYRNMDSMNKEETKEYCKTIYESSNNLYNLLENLLQWSRTQLGNLKLNPESLNINEVTEEIIDLLRINIEEKNIQVNNKINVGTTAYADRNVFGTIMRNLLSNAIKFTAENGRVALHATTESDHTLISVSDTGQGISKEHLDNLFRVKSNHYTKGNSNGQGTGLGLILCKELVEKSNGKIWAESTPGEGSTFKFTLPRKK